MERYINDHVNPKKLRNKAMVDRIVKNIFKGITIICASIIVIIVVYIFIKGMSPFVKNYVIDGKEYRVNFFEFIFGKTWFVYPNQYGIGFIIINTIYIVALSLLIAAPVSVLTALFISKIAPKKLGRAISYVIEMLASIPSIIYGVFGIGVITVFVKNIASFFGYQSNGGISTMATIVVLAIMIIPTMTMLSITSINAVKQDIINGSLALGASVTQTNFKVVLASAKSGIFSGLILGVGRALGEATAISMVVGNSKSGPNFNLFDTTRTLTSTMLLGLKETSGLDYDIRFSVGIVLIGIILLTNFALNYVKRKIGRLS
jgi:phosphate transport system permease protein